jgi:hypothetical protein
MPDELGRLFVEDIAADLGIEQATWRAHVSRGQAIAPIAKVIVGSHVRPVWDPQEYADYKAGRRDRQEESPQ